MITSLSQSIHCAMRLIATTSCLTVLGSLLQAVENPATQPVTVTDESVMHTMLSRPYRAPDSYYFQKGRPEDVDPIRSQIKAFNSTFADEFAEAYKSKDPEGFAQITAAREELSKMSKRDSRGEKGKPFQALVRPYYQELKEARAADPRSIALNESLREARAKNITPVDIEHPRVTLDNGLMRVVLVPTLGMRVLNAVDLISNQSLAGKANNPTAFEDEPYLGYLPFTSGMVEPSFPYFEHGVNADQESAYRIIEHEDGSVTVAMSMHFTQHQGERDLNRYGKYSNRVLSGYVTLRPGESKFELRYRVDNPLPIRRSNRLWLNHTFEAEGYNEEHILYPVGWVAEHGAARIYPFKVGTKEQQTYTNVSHFGLFPDYAFSGAYLSSVDSNLLYCPEPSSTPGMKLYTPPRIPAEQGGFAEIWFGSSPVFEDNGFFLPPFVHTEIVVDYWIASGIGRATWADKDVAINATDGKLKVVVSRPLQLKVGSIDVMIKPGQVIEGTYNPAKFPLDITIDGEVVDDFQVPLAHTDVSPRHAEIKDRGGIYFEELDEISPIGRGHPSAQAATYKGRNMLKETTPLSDEKQRNKAQSYANTLYRFGHFETVQGLLERIGDSTDANHLRLMYAMEHQSDGIADIKADSQHIGSAYLLALYAKASGKTDSAIALLSQAIEQEPRVFRPRVVLAYWQKDLDSAKALVAENLASIPALWVASELGDAASKEGLAKLLTNNPGAAEEIARLRKEVDGIFTHPKRLKTLLPKQKK